MRYWSAGSPGPGTFTGDIIESGVIFDVDGNDYLGGRSAAVSIESPVVGNITLTGQIGTLGNNIFGVVTTQPVAGNVTIGGSLSSIGGGATAVSPGGDISGKLLFNGAETNTGHRYPTWSPPCRPPSDKLVMDDLLRKAASASRSATASQAAPVLPGPPVNLDPGNTDQDNDGVPDGTGGRTTTFS